LISIRLERMLKVCGLNRRCGGRWSSYGGKGTCKNVSTPTLKSVFE
ncbi:hypothetical protein A2U01_0057274, partial [Trifolium medium]|nr:hypothetical protein [Trifolium medium]